MALQKSQSNDKLSRKVMTSSYHIELKTFIEARCTNNVHTGEIKGKRFVGRFFSDKVRKRVVYFGLFEGGFLFFFISRGKKTK